MFLSHIICPWRRCRGQQYSLTYQSDARFSSVSQLKTFHLNSRAASVGPTVDGSPTTPESHMNGGSTLMCLVCESNSVIYGRPSWNRCALSLADFTAYQTQNGCNWFIMDYLHTCQIVCRLFNCWFYDCYSCQFISNQHEYRLILSESKGKTYLGWWVGWFQLLAGTLQLLHQPSVIKINGHFQML